MTTTHTQARIEADERVPMIHIYRDFAATPAQLFRAHTDPELFARWVGPSDVGADIDYWDGSTFVFDSRSESSGNTFAPNTSLSPRHMDEFTVGFERQLSNVMGVGVRYISRNWSNFIDDIRSFNADGTLNRVVANIDSADRTYRGIEFTADI